VQSILFSTDFVNTSWLFVPQPPLFSLSLSLLLDEALVLEEYHRDRFLAAKRLRLRLEEVLPARPDGGEGGAL